LNAVLLTPAHQEAFCDRQGLELMLRCLKEQKYASVSAVKSINYALSGSYVNCIKWVELGGLKYICPIFMGKGLPRSKEASYIQKADVKEAEEANIATLSQLCMQLHNTVVHDCGARLLVKCTESGYEKLKRAVDLFDDRLRRLGRTEEAIAKNVAVLQAQGEEAQEELAAYVEEDNLRSLVSQSIHIYYYIFSLII